VGDPASYAEFTDRRATQLLLYYFLLLFCINCAPSLTFFPSQQYKSIVESVTPLKNLYSLDQEPLWHMCALVVSVLEVVHVISVIDLEEKYA